MCDVSHTSVWLFKYMCEPWFIHVCHTYVYDVTRAFMFWDQPSDSIHVALACFGDTTLNNLVVIVSVNIHVNGLLIYVYIFLLLEFRRPNLITGLKAGG